LLATSGISKARPSLIRSHEAVRGPEGLDLRLRFGDALAQPVDIAAEPGRGVARRVDLVGFERRYVELRDRVRALGRELRILRAELDRQDARLARRIDQQVVEIGVEHPVLGRPVEGVRAEAEHHQHALHGAEAVPGEIARHHHLNLARHRLLVDRRELVGAFLCGPGEGRVAALEEELRFAGVARADHVDEEARPQRDHEGRPDDPADRAAQDPRDLREAEPILGLDLRPGNNLGRALTNTGHADALNAEADRAAVDTVRSLLVDVKVAQELRHPVTDKTRCRDDRDQVSLTLTD
jgi:hypothetical protein